MIALPAFFSASPRSTGSRRAWPSRAARAARRGRWVAAHELSRGRPGGRARTIGRVTQIQPPLIAAGSPVRTAARASLADAVNWSAAPAGRPVHARRPLAGGKGPRSRWTVRRSPRATAC